MAIILCPECKGSVSDQASQCPKCGYPIKRSSNLQQTIQVEQKKSRSMAIFLSLIFGGIGAHKFYVNKPGVGIIYLLFVWTFIPSIIGFFEAIQYAMMSDDVFQQKYLAKKL